MRVSPTVTTSLLTVMWNKSIVICRFILQLPNEMGYHPVSSVTQQYLLPLGNNVLHCQWIFCDVTVICCHNSIVICHLGCLLLTLTTISYCFRIVLQQLSCNNCPLSLTIYTTVVRLATVTVRQYSLLSWYHNMIQNWHRQHCIVRIPCWCLLNWQSFKVLLDFFFLNNLQKWH